MIRSDCMRWRTIVGAALGFAVAASSALADVGPEFRVGFGVTPSPVGCQHRFNAQGTLDDLSIHLTLRDAFNVPIADCEVAVTLGENAGTVALCGCEPLRQSAITDADGITTYSFSRLGGNGSMAIFATLHCAGDVALWEETIDFTSPDLDGSCDPEPASSTGVIDLGMWVAGLTEYRQASDYDCDGSVGVIDAGIWASGLGVGCP